MKYFTVPIKILIATAFCIFEQYAFVMFEVGSTLTQMVSAVASGDRQHVGASAVEAAQSLRTFVSAVHGVCSTRKDTPMDRLIHLCYFLR